jgi:hypothetical protein
LLGVGVLFAGACERSLGYQGRADVVGMAVAAEVVVADDDLGRVWRTTRTRRPAASSKSACQKLPGASFSGVPIIPEST